jgi:hypothetical protein
MRRARLPSRCPPSRCVHLVLNAERPSRTCPIRPSRRRCPEASRFTRDPRRPRPAARRSDDERPRPRARPRLPSSRETWSASRSAPAPGRRHPRPAPGRRGHARARPPRAAEAGGVVALRGVLRPRAGRDGGWSARDRSWGRSGPAPGPSWPKEAVGERTFATLVTATEHGEVIERAFVRRGALSASRRTGAIAQQHGDDVDELPAEQLDGPSPGGRGHSLLACASSATIVHRRVVVSSSASSSSCDLARRTFGAGALFSTVL